MSTKGGEKRKHKDVDGDIAAKLAPATKPKRGAENSTTSSERGDSFGSPRGRGAIA